MSEETQIKNKQGRRRFLDGVVLSDKMNKTRVVQVRWRTKHAQYLKVILKTNKYKAHDEKNESKTGDFVRMMETRPLSKDKRWVIKEILKKAAEIVAK
ncbi:MAG TPA: 30S ribosomal protein S17 [Candidatus Omnitrophota bacterium]|nr:30S ribosomal protein S17 [Candidatus Omnitrophota bacterium]